MIFFIGGQSVAYATSTHETKHYANHQHGQQMQHMPCHQEASKTTSLETSQASLQQAHQHHSSTQDLAAMSVDKCEHESMPDAASCQDCYSPTHCQTSNWNAVQVPSIAWSKHIFHIESRLNSDYQVQHQIGYWQEILRPPKT